MEVLEFVLFTEIYQVYYTEQWRLGSVLHSALIFSIPLGNSLIAFGWCSWNGSRSTGSSISTSVVRDNSVITTYFISTQSCQVSAFVQTDSQQRSLPRSNYAAYFARFSAGDHDSQSGQYEAAKVLKFTPGATIHIVLPQGRRSCLTSVPMKSRSSCRYVSSIRAWNQTILWAGTAADRRCETVWCVSAGGNLPYRYRIVTLVW